MLEPYERILTSQIIFDALKENTVEFEDLLNIGEGDCMFFMMNLYEIQSSETFIKLSQLFEEKLCELEKKSKTAKLWISYFRMVSILKDFVAAERMGCLLYTSRCV